MLQIIRRILAVVFFLMITLLFLDFTGTLHRWFDWMTKIQFLPALWGLNAGVLMILFILTLTLGRIYCSIICPLGVFQDVISWIAGQRTKNRFRYSRALSWLRYSILILFFIAAFMGIHYFVNLLAPYSAYGRIASNLFAPLYQWINNGLAYVAERVDSYAFYSVEVRIKSMATFGIASATLVLIAILAWRNGRTYCNTVCPVGTILGYFARRSFLKPVINASKCNGCGLCARNCKSSCIDSKTHQIDYSRCVTCMDCIGKCRQKAIRYTYRVNSKQTNKKKQTAKPTPDSPVGCSRRSFLTASAVVTATALLKAQEKKIDGGLAALKDRKIPKRNCPLIPPGSLEISIFTRTCTACQLCISVCPTQVLRPSANLYSLMQPRMSYEYGYCRPECTKCSNVCPCGAIQPITPEEKSSVQIGHAVWIQKNCVVNTDGVECGNCARHCPAGAIQMVERDPGTPDSPKIPVINTERCIGCGACENLCPARPFSAIYVEGHYCHSIL